MTTITNIAQRILDENNYTIEDVTITNLEYLIQNAIDYVNLRAGTSIADLTGGTTFADVLKDDNFNDNTIDTTYWEKFYYPNNSSDVTETGQRIQMVCDTAGDVLGLNTISSYDLSEASIKISIPVTPVVHQQAIWLLSDIYRDGAGNRMPEMYPALANGYNLYKSPLYGGITRIRRNKYKAFWSTWELIFSGAWKSSTGSIKIVTQNGKITFYDDDVAIYSEAWDSNIPTALHVVIASYAATTYVGTAYFDNFVASNATLVENKSITASSAEILAVKTATAVSLRAYLDRGPNKSVSGVSISSVISDPQYDFLTKSLEEQIKELKLLNKEPPIYVKNDPVE